MNVERGPVINDVVLCGGHCDDTHLRMFTEQVVTQTRPSARLIKRDNHEIWQGPLDTLHDFRIVGNLADDFYVRLVCKSCEKSLPHETRTVGHENADGFFHGAPCATSIGFSVS